MLHELRGIQSDLKKARTLLPKPLTKQVQSSSTKEKFKLIVDYYFRTVRAALVSGNIPDKDIEGLDAQMQQLLELSHTSSRASTYLQFIKDAIASTVTLEQICLTQSFSKVPVVINSTDTQIVQTLSALLPSAANSYQQAIGDLQATTRLSWRGPATDLREALRETLDHLAPDKDVEKQSGFKLEKDTKGPTMKQKVRFVLSKRNLSSAATATTEQTVTTIEDLMGAFVRSIYQRSSVSTHTATSKGEVIRIRDLVRIALCELLEIPT